MITSASVTGHSPRSLSSRPRATRTSSTTHAFRDSHFRCFWLRPAIMRHDLGLAASPPVRRTIEVERGVTPLFPHRAIVLALVDGRRRGRAPGDRADPGRRGADIELADSDGVTPLEQRGAAATRTWRRSSRSPIQPGEVAELGRGVAPEISWGHALPAGVAFRVPASANGGTSAHSPVCAPAGRGSCARVRSAGAQPTRLR